MSETFLTGRAAAPGLAIGPVIMLTSAVAGRTATGDAAAETAALRLAIQAASAAIAALMERVDQDAAAMLEFQLALLQDDALTEPAYGAIASGTAADEAWRAALDAEIAGYQSAEDDYFRARAADLVDLRDRVRACRGHCRDQVPDRLLRNFPRHGRRLDHAVGAR